jgi:hypothetical protein
VAIGSGKRGMVMRKALLATGSASLAFRSSASVSAATSVAVP